MATSEVAACLNIMRRMPPSEIDTNLSGLVNLVPDSMDELLQRIDQVSSAASLPNLEMFCDFKSLISINLALFVAACCTSAAFERGNRCREWAPLLAV
jgi:F-actin capping protein, beta subunit